MTDLSTLLARVEAGSGADIDLSDAVMRALFDGGAWFRTADLTTDLNAVIALVEARLPGRFWNVGMASANSYASDIAGLPGEGCGTTPARALLAALIRAEMEKVK